MLVGALNPSLSLFSTIFGDTCFLGGLIASFFGDITGDLAMGDLGGWFGFTGLICLLPWIFVPGISCYYLIGLLMCCLSGD